MKYALRMTDGDRGAVVVETRADGRIEGGLLSLDYVFDGADYRLTVGKDRLVHRRFGDAELFLEFREGERTACSLRSGGVGGEFSVFTEKLKIVWGKNGCFVRLRYSSAAQPEITLVKTISVVALG